MMTTTKLAHRFTKGVSWHGSAKGSIINGIGSVRDPGWPRDWPRFRDAMERAIEIEERHAAALADEINQMLDEVEKAESKE